MNENYKKVIILLIVPGLLNTIATIYVFNNFSHNAFTGYLFGTILSIILTGIWLLQVKNGINANSIIFLKKSFKGFFLKLIVFLLFVFIGYHYLNFDRIYFAIAFFLGIFISIIIEVKFYLSIYKQK
jgi:hypothetical protein